MSFKLLFSFLLILTSCSHSVHLVNVSDHSLHTSYRRGRIIKAQSDQKVIFWFTYDTNYVEEARQKLIAKCPNGSIKNIVTRYSSSHSFLHWTNKIFMQGRCFRNS